MPKSNGNRDRDHERADSSASTSRAEATEGQVRGGDARRASPPPAGSGPKERKGSWRNGGDDPTKTEPEAAKAGDTEVLPGGTPAAVRGVAGGDETKGSGAKGKGVPGGEGRKDPAAAMAMRDPKVEEGHLGRG